MQIVQITDCGTLTALAFFPFSIHLPINLSGKRSLQEKTLQLDEWKIRKKLPKHFLQATPLQTW